MCGIAAIISQEPVKFNVNHFNILGTLNDERGGDSCGYFIDGTVNKGVADMAYFRYFTTKQKYPKTASIALLHCRKTSASYVSNLEQAQPVIIEEDGKCKFVLMHNGTIFNIRALADKYIPNFNIAGLSDSQILAQIIYTSGFKILEEYEGAAALIIVDYRKGKPQVFVFKGSSCFNEVNENHERPLYYARIDNKVYISSMYYSLYCCNYAATIYNVPINSVCEVKDNTLKPCLLVDRNKVKKSVATNVYSYYGYANNNIFYDDDQVVQVRYDYLSAISKIISEKKPVSHLTANGRIIYDPKLQSYRLDAVGDPILAHGKFKVYPTGYICKNADSDLGKMASFYQGTLLKDEACYDFLKELEHKYAIKDDFKKLPKIIDLLAYGFIKLNNQYVKANFHFDDDHYTKVISGSFVTLFNLSSVITISNDGSKVTFKPISCVEALDVYTKVSKLCNSSDIISNIKQQATKYLESYADIRRD